MNSNPSSPGVGQSSNAETLRLEQAAVIAGRLSHDFGNYLTGIMGFTELSLQQAPAGSTLQRYLQEVLQSAKAGAEWVQRLHRFCRRTNLPAWPTCLDLAVADEKARHVLEHKTGLVWEIDLPSDLPLVAVDAESVSIILRELIDNTCEASGGRGTLRFQARVVNLSNADSTELLGNPEPGAYVELTVIDQNGIIDPGVFDKLLKDVFFSTKPKHRGLGLWMVYGLLKRHNGGIRLFQTRPAGGLGVSMFLPVACVPKFAMPPGQQLSALIVLADRRAGANTRKLLEAAGCQVAIASSQVEALELLVEPDKFMLAFIETQLSNENGLNLARRMLAHNPIQRFVFLQSNGSFSGTTEDDLVKRFPLVRGPLQVPLLFQAFEDALRIDIKKGK